MICRMLAPGRMEHPPMSVCHWIIQFVPFLIPLHFTTSCRPLNAPTQVSWKGQFPFTCRLLAI
jgi:hypothetical protein